MPTSKRERQKAQRRAKLEARERANRRRRLIRRSLIIVLVAGVIVGSAAFLFSGGTSTSTSTTTTTVTGATTTTTTSTSTSTSTSSTTTTVAAASFTQAEANAVAVRAGCPPSTKTRVNTLSWKTSPPLTINKSLTYYATFNTTAGRFVVQLDAATAPITTNNFIFLVDHNFYHCVIFHRVIPGFVIQGGDPQGTGLGGPGYTIKDELPKKATPQYPLYSVAMANTGSPDTGGSQFFIVSGASGENLPNTYSLFGKVISGFGVIATINNEGNSNANDSGVPPEVTHRILTITISETKPS